MAILDLDDEEADKLLAVYDPVAAIAQTNQKALDELIESAKWQDQGIGKLLEDLRGQEQAPETSLRQLDVKRPPAMAWVLIGIPTTRFAEIAAHIEQLAAIDGLICETTLNDGPQNG